MSPERSEDWVWLWSGSATARPGLRHPNSRFDRSRTTQLLNMAQHAAQTPARRKGAQIHSHLTPRRLLQLEQRPVRLFWVQEDDGHAVRAN